MLYFVIVTAGCVYMNAFFNHLSVRACCTLSYGEILFGILTGDAWINFIYVFVSFQIGLHLWCDWCIKMYTNRKQVYYFAHLQVFSSM